MPSINLAKVEEAIEARRRGTTNRDYTLPSRRQTELPGLEVNARTRRPNDSGADILMQTLGLATDTAEAFTDLGAAKQAEENKGIAADAARDFQTGSKNEELFAESRVYKRAYDVEGARRSAFELDAVVTKAVQDRLADEDDPATLEDIQGVIDDAYRAAVLDEGGNPLDFGEPQAKLVVAQQLVETRQRLMAGAIPVIKQRTDEKVLSDIGFNAVQERIQGGQAGSIATVSLPASDAAQAVSTTPSAPPLTGLPVAGRITSKFGPRAKPNAAASSNHGGIDIAVPEGTPVQLRAGGRVVATGFGKERGNWVEVDHGGGVISRYFHLREVGVAKGAVVNPGDSVGESGKTGNATGAHLHYSVLVDGKPVDPTKHKFSTSSGSAELTPANSAPAAPGRAAPYDFEALMARVPNTIPRGQAKEYLLTSLVTAAEESNDAALLDGLWQSKRADGTPSFSPKEIALIRDKRDTLVDKIDRDARQARTKRYEENSEVLMSAFAQGEQPSIETIRQWEEDDLIPGSLAFSLINNIESEAQQELREARAEVRLEEAEANADLDMSIGAEVEARRAGVLTGTSYEADLARFNSGELGVGKKAATRFRALRTAADVAGQAALQSPEAAQAAADLKRLYGPKKGGSLVLQSRTGSGPSSAIQYPAMMARFNQLVKQGEPPQTAMVKAVSEYGPKNDPSARKAREARAAELRAKQGR